MARRLARVEGLLGVRLFERHAGVLRPTDSGRIVIRSAERIELDVDALTNGVTNADSMAAGKVRLTAVPLILNYILIPALPTLLRSHPRLQIELVADPRNLSVIDREADIALRMARPDKEYRAVARRLGSIDYAVYREVAQQSHSGCVAQDKFGALNDPRPIGAALAKPSRDMVLFMRSRSVSISRSRARAAQLKTIDRWMCRKTDIALNRPAVAGEPDSFRR